MEERTKSSVNLETPSRWRRFFAYLLDIIINITFIWLIANIIIIFVVKTTLWNMIVWIKALDNKNNSANLWQISLRYIVFYQTLPLFIFYFSYFYTISRNLTHIRKWCSDLYCGEENILGFVLFCILLIFTIISLVNIIEIFFKCPTFIDNRLWIKRIYKKSK